MSYVFLDASLPPLACTPQGDAVTVGLLAIAGSDRAPVSQTRYSPDGGRWVGTITAPRDEIRIVVTGSDTRAAVDTVVDSFVELPRGYSSVPDTDGGVSNIVADLRAVGLRADVDDAVLDRASLVIDPAPGSVVPRGSTVHLTSSGPAVVADPAVVEPGGAIELTFPTRAERVRLFSYTRIVDGKGQAGGALVSATRPGESPRYSITGEIGLTDHVVTGPGPDRIVLPPGIEPGRYEICNEGAPAVCVRITVR